MEAAGPNPGLAALVRRRMSAAGRPQGSGPPRRRLACPSILRRSVPVGR